MATLVRVIQQPLSTIPPVCKAVMSLAERLTEMLVELFDSGIFPYIWSIFLL